MYTAWEYNQISHTSKASGVVKLETMLWALFILYSHIVHLIPDFLAKLHFFVFFPSFLSWFFSPLLHTVPQFCNLLLDKYL